MATLAPQIGPTGIVAPDFDDVLAQIKNLYLGIYGSDSDVDDDTQDGQFIATQAQAIYDAGQAVVAAYNAFSPDGAQGTGLSSLVKLMGIRRQSASFSTDILTITGTANAVILNGQVGDSLSQGTVWNLPASVTIPNSGTINVTITAAQAGNVTFAPGQIDDILTPTAGWQSAVNIGPAAPGAAVEQDPTLKQRAANSVAGPALTVFEAVYAAIGNVPGVSRFFLYENNTDVNDGNGQGPHSIYAVILGGDPVAICTAIAEKKTPGTSTHGTTPEVIIDSNGVPNTISYYPLTLVVISVVITVKQLTGYTSAAGLAIQQSVAQFISSLSIGEECYLNRLLAPANLSGDAATKATGLTQASLDAFSATFNITAIEQSRPNDAPPAVQDVPIAFNEAAVCAVANITLNLT